MAGLQPCQNLTKLFSPFSLSKSVFVNFSFGSVGYIFVHVCLLVYIFTVLTLNLNTKKKKDKKKNNPLFKLDFF